MAETCMVYFQTGACDLATAARFLSSYGLTVVRRGDTLIASRPGSPQFRISLSSEPHVLAEAVGSSQGTPHAAAMRECAARFEVVIDDLDAALDEINTLIEVQGALQDASRGFLFLSWNGNLSEPWNG
jgi:hypothetical protein